jgi:uncharacterized protein YndB with AHSA1/START domain
MPEIRHRVGIAAPAARVHEALTTTKGLAGWWTRDVEGDPAPGGTLRFFFGRPEARVVAEVEEVTPTHVAWRCSESVPDWVGTRFTFDLEPSDDETVVLFTHAGWREPVEFMSHCSTKWAYFLLGMKAWLEGGSSSAFPDDLKISAWG